MSHKLDYIITTDAMTSVVGLQRHVVMREPFVLVLPRRLADAIAEPRLSDLARNHPYVRYSTRSLIGEQIARYLKQNGVTPPDTLGGR